MKPKRRSRILAWLVVTFLVVTLVLLAWFFPIIAAITFIALVTSVAVSIGKVEGSWSGLKYFIKEILLGW